MKILKILGNNCYFNKLRVNLNRFRLPFGVVRLSTVEGFALSPMFFKDISGGSGWVNKYDIVLDFIKKRYGFDLFRNEKYESSVEIVIERMSSLNCKEPRRYVEILQKDKTELQNILQKLSVGETYFFRTPEDFKNLKIIVKEIAKRKKIKDTIRIWCAGCSTGEEVYSIAAVLAEWISSQPFCLEILGTDILEASLQKARAGLFSRRAFREIKDKEFSLLIQEYFNKSGENYIIKDTLKKSIKIEFRNHNILEKIEYSPDIIFCRNVLIYFSSDAIKRAIENIYDVLNEGGYLFLGYSESLSAIEKMLGTRLGFKSILHEDKVFYQKEILKSKNIEDRPKHPKRRIIKIGHKMEFTKEIFDLFEEGVNLFGQKKYYEAKKLFEKIKNAHPYKASVYFYLGQIYYKEKDYNKAIEYFDDAIKFKNGIFPEAYFIKAFVFWEKDQKKDAIKEFEKAIFLEPEFALARFFKAILHFELGQLENAKIEFKNALRDLKDSREVKFLEGTAKDFYIKICEDYISKIKT